MLNKARSTMKRLAVIGLAAATVAVLAGCDEMGHSGGYNTGSYYDSYSGSSSTLGQGGTIYDSAWNDLVYDMGQITLNSW